MAVDSAIMLLDASRGVEPQTIKLFKICRERNLPIITFINKMDMPALEAFELLDNVEKVLGISAVPLVWPMGSGRDFKGYFDLYGKKLHPF
jgi:peptide chain release factor 3